MKKVVIVGGGFAGWYTAAVLNKHTDWQITVLESKAYPRLGVGETLGWSAPYDWSRLLGLENDTQLMYETGSSYKYGLTATNFYADNTSYSYGKFFNLKANSLARFYSEFTYPEYHEPWSVRENDIGLQQAWFYFNQHTKKDFNDYIQELNETSYFTSSNSAPYSRDNEYVLRTQEGWSYHIDAENFIKFLKGLCDRNVVLKENKVLGLRRSVSETVLLTSNGPVEADLYIDCSGFQRVLVNSVKEMELTDYNMPTTNSAWVCPTRYDDPHNEIFGGTQIFGEDWGWRFRVNLYHRAGNGCVFDSTQTDPELVKRFIETYTKDKQLFPPKLIQWKPSYVKKPWVGNVLALGISSYFTDPFDAPTFDVHSRNLEDLIKGVTADEFNQKHELVTLERKYRLMYNFSTSKRSGTFWDQQRSLFDESIWLDIMHNRLDNIDSRLTHNWYQMYYRMCVASGYDRTNINLRLNLDQPTQDMVKAFFTYNRARNNFIKSQSWPNLYDWLKNNRFNGEDHTQVLERMIQ